MIVCLMGPSTAGKSTVAKRLQDLHPRLFARVPVDFFFVPRPAGVTIPAYLAQPLAYDWAAVDRAIAAGGSERSTPDCDFERFRWRSVTGGLPIAEAPIYLLDGMRPHPRCDHLVLLELDPQTQQQRLLDRDARWGTRVADRRAFLDATFARGCAEATRAPDLRLPATESADRNARAIVQQLEHAGMLPGAGDG